MVCIVRQESGKSALLRSIIKLPVKQIQTTHFQMDDNRSINLQHGSIIATDSSDQIVSIYAGVEAVNDAVANLLPCCDRSTQERFMQVLTDHIRKLDNADAKS